MSFAISELIWYCQTNTVRVSFSGSFEYCEHKTCGQEVMVPNLQQSVLENNILEAVKPKQLTQVGVGH